MSETLAGVARAQLLPPHQSLTETRHAAALAHGLKGFLAVRALRSA